jgi:hypothetical protein
MEKAKDKTENKTGVKWYHYVATFFGTFFLTNAVPHFTHGVSGDFFPSPFADPPGKGLSSPIVNTLWACFNLLIGYILLRVGKTSTQNKISILIVFLGILIVGIMLSLSFIDKVKM